MRMWEDICSRCGLCCHEKVILDDSVVISLAEPCKFYDGEKRECSVYKDRLKECKRCVKVTPLRAMMAPYMPDECNYVRLMRKWHLRFAKRRETVVMNQPLPDLEFPT